MVPVMVVPSGPITERFQECCALCNPCTEEEHIFLMRSGASAYVMSPELKKSIEALRQAAASQEQPGVDDKKQLPKAIKDMLGPFANQLSRYGTRSAVVKLARQEGGGTFLHVWQV